MPGADPVLAVVREWVAKAEGDLRAPVHLLTLGTDCPSKIVCYHAQQCVEEYLKALLVLAGTDFPKTHDLDRLAQLLPRGSSVGLTPVERAELSDHAVAARYPGAGEIPMRNARRAVRLARRARKAARAQLPPIVKRTKGV